MEKTGSLSRESEKCKKCKYKKTCASKYMEMCAYVYDDGTICDTLNRDNMCNNARPMLKETINIPTAFGRFTVDKEDFEKQLYAQLNINAGLMYGA